LPFSRMLIALACIAGLIALPATATAAKKKPKTAQSHVIKTSKGNQLAVPITVRYTLKGKTLDRARLTTRTAIAAKLPGRRLLRAVETRQVPGKARVRVEHHPFFSVRHTRVLRKALNAGQTVKLTVASSSAVDVNGDGDIDDRSSQKSTQTLAAPTRPDTPVALKHQQGDDPCGVLGLTSATCQNVAGATFRSTHLWDGSQQDIACPAAFPYAANSVSTETTSKHYTQTTGVVGPTGGVTQVTIIDDNVSGHPITYAPTAACTTTNVDG